MTRLPGIGPTPADVAAQVAREERARFDEPRDATSRHGAREGGFGAGMRFGQFDLERGLGDDREAAFLDKVRRALSENGEFPSADEDAKAPRLLAMAGGSEACPDAPSLPVPERAVPASARIETLVERIEHGLRMAPVSAPASGPGGGVSITLDLGGAGGLASVSVSMSPDIVDVVLSRAGEAAADDLAAAAQALADRLQVRFPRRIVRVFEADASAGESGGGSGLDEIGALLSRPGTPR